MPPHVPSESPPPSPATVLDRGRTSRRNDGPRPATGAAASQHIAATRNPDRLADFGWHDQVTGIALDAHDEASATTAFANAGPIDVVYYLVHGIGQPDFRDADNRAAANVEAGFVWINDISKHFLGTPFGGFKQSGIGREECLEELISFTQEKNININLAVARKG